MTAAPAGEVEHVLNNMTAADQKRAFAILRSRFMIHDLESQWNIPAEIILEAISESGDLTQRGVRGVIADRSFHRLVFPKLSDNGWIHVNIDGEKPFDALLSKDGFEVSIQIKMQRKRHGVPLRAVDVSKRFFPNGASFWVAEVQRTRTGRATDGQLTRPYRFGDFQILAVNLQPSTNNWGDFMYTVADWLIPYGKNANFINTFQPVSPSKDGDWTDSFEECVHWLQNTRRRQIGLDARGGSLMIDPDSNITQKSNLKKRFLHEESELFSHSFSRPKK
ncbi:MAG: hypothetical protein ACOYOH_08465 [Paracraurococcus sp.]